MNIKELLKLAGKQGKVVFIDEEGNIKGVFLSGDTYMEMNDMNAKAPQEVLESEAERINRAILEAQLKEETTPTPFNPPIQSSTIQQTSSPQAQRLDALLSKRAEQLFRSMPYKSSMPTNDIRSEVMDPNFDFNKPDSNDDEVIRPNFDNI